MPFNCLISVKVFFFFFFFPQAKEVVDIFQTGGQSAKGLKLTIIVINNIITCYNKTFYNNRRLILLILKCSMFCKTLYHIGT